MEIIFIFNKQNEEYLKVYHTLSVAIKKTFKDKEILIVHKEKISTRNKADVVVIMEENFELLQLYLDHSKQLSKSLILTENITSSHIMQLVKYTKNVCYIRNNMTRILKRIYLIYMEGKTQNA